MTRLTANEIYVDSPESERKALMDQLDAFSAGYDLATLHNEQQPTLEIKRLSPDAKLPQRAHPSDSGLDIYAAEDVIIEPGETAVVKTGIAVKLPPGHDAYIKPRSGVSTKTKLRVVSPPIDAGYRGELGVIVDNIAAPLNEYDGQARDITDKLVTYVKYPCDVNSYLIRKGDRIAQLVVTPVALPQVVEVDELDETERGDSGYGASGLR